MPDGRLSAGGFDEFWQKIHGFRAGTGSTEKEKRFSGHGGFICESPFILIYWRIRNLFELKALRAKPPICRGHKVKFSTLKKMEIIIPDLRKAFAI